MSSLTGSLERQMRALYLVLLSEDEIGSPSAVTAAFQAMPFGASPRWYDRENDVICDPSETICARIPPKVLASLSKYAAEFAEKTKIEIDQNPLEIFVNRNLPETRAWK